MEREERIKAEAAALWKALYGEPPPLMTDGATMLAVALRSLPEQRYERLRAEQLRPTDVVLPR
jgi:hypothetical protein